MVRVDNRGFVYAGHLKVCRVVDGQLEFKGKNNSPGRERAGGGEQFVYVKPEELVTAVRLHDQEQKEM